MAKYFRVRNYEKMQGDKRRENDTWIRLHVKVITDPDFQRLSDDSKAHLMLIWAFARPRGNVLLYDAKYITESIHVKNPVDLQALLKSRWIELCDKNGQTLKRAQNARKMLAICAQDASNLRASRAGEEERRGEEIGGEEKREESARDLFAEAILAYPHRPGTNQSRGAREEWDRNIANGVDPAVMHAGILRYAAYCKATGDAGTKFVRKAENFLRKGEYEDDWPLPEEPAPYLDDGVTPNPQWLKAARATA